MHVFITGADGLLGSNIVRVLLEQQHSVTALIERGKKSVTLEGLPIHCVSGDILSKNSMIELSKGADAIIHCAACTNIWPARSERTRTINIEGTENLVEAALVNNVQRFVFIGTANSFGNGTLDMPGDETQAYQAFRIGLDYMDSKRQAQELVLEAVKQRGLPAIVVNPTFMIGAYDSKPSSGAMILALAESKVPAFTKGGKNYICVRDAAIGCVNALHMGTIGEAYILGNENLTYREMFHKISTVTGAQMPKLQIPSFIVKSYGWFNSQWARMRKSPPTVSYEMAILSTEFHYYSAARARRELKLPQSPIEVGILECYDWFVQQGVLPKKH